jgi:hypothetical protein
VGSAPGTYSFWSELLDAAKRIVIKFTRALSSRKFWAWVTGTYASVTFEGVPANYRIAAVVLLSIGYIVSTAWEDIGTH